MGMNKNQELAAFSDFSKNVLVSAGAGSGKTFVLTTRIVDLFKKSLNSQNGVKPSELLVLTYTNAAAAELKERIKKEVLKVPSIAHLIPQIEQAYFATFDSFNISLCKKYFYALNISPKLSVADNAAFEIKKEEILNEILNEYYINKDEVLFDYLTKFTNKDDNSLLTALKSIIEFVDKQENTLKYLDEYVRNYFSENMVAEIESTYKNRIIEAYNEFIENLKKLSLLDAPDKKKNEINNILNESKNISYSDISRILDMPLPDNRGKLSDEFKELNAKVKESYINLDNLCKCKYDDVRKNYLSLKDIEELLINILKEYYLKLEEFCKLHGVYSFNQIQKKAIELVSENEDIREEIKHTFKQIMIDEYQDTSYLQEKFVSYIENNNLFMVGDIKQSIYRFNNAFPENFKHKYETYEHITLDSYKTGNYNHDAKGFVINMNQNYRSRSTVLDDINNMFNDLMTLEYGDADYVSKHNMEFGNHTYDKVDVLDQDYQMDLISYEHDTKVLPYTQHESEAMIIANDILDKVGKKFIILDKDIKTKEGEEEKAFRPISYNDFCIIADTKTPFDTYKKTLEKFGIPAVICREQDIKESYVTLVCINLLKLIAYTKVKLDHKYDSNEVNEIKSQYKHALTSVLRSFLFEYSDERIYEIIVNKSDDKVFETLAYLADLIGKYDSGSIYKEALNKFKVYEKINKMGNTDASLHEIEFLYNKIISLSDLGYSLLDISASIKKMFEIKNAFSYTVDFTKQNGVKIMTAHKSKGLEFSVCYFPNLTNTINTDELSDDVNATLEYGIHLPVYDGGKTTAVNKELSNKIIKNKILSERIRLFYVAVTRAREKIIFIKKSRKEEGPKSFDKHNCFADYIDYLEDKNPNIFENKIYVQTDEILDFAQNINNNSKTLNNNPETIYPTYDYMTEKASESRISKTMTKVMNQNVSDAIHKGLIYHEASEMLDMKNPLNDIETLPVSNDVKNIVKKVLNIDIMKNISNAKALKEHEFSCIIDKESYHGIIDLLLVYDDHIDIIDYKLKNFDDEAYDRQLSIYKKYVETKTDKPINCYLLSIIDAKVRKVEV